MSFRCSLPYRLKQGLTLNLGLVHLVRVAANELQRSNCTGIAVEGGHGQLLCG